MAVSLFPLQALYMFYALAIVCDDFFVPSLEKICEVRGKDLGPLAKPGSGAGGAWGWSGTPRLWQSTEEERPGSRGR